MLLGACHDVFRTNDSRLGIHSFTTLRARLKTRTSGIRSLYCNVQYFSTTELLTYCTDMYSTPTYSTKTEYAQDVPERMYLPLTPLNGWTKRCYPLFCTHGNSINPTWHQPAQPREQPASNSAFSIRESIITLHTAQRPTIIRSVL